MKMPDTIELPRPQDFCRDFRRKGEWRCAMSWAFHLGLDWCKFSLAFIKQAKVLNLRGTGGGLVLCVNDDPANSFDDIATCFEAGVEACGYEIEGKKR